MSLASTRGPATVCHPVRLRDRATQETRGVFGIPSSRCCPSDTRAAREMVVDALSDGNEISLICFGDEMATLVD